MTSPKSDPHGVLVLDKTSGPTSHDAVAVARRALGTRAVGHTGTLDPMATGVLLLVVGEATKLVTMLGGQAKAYRATIRLGVATHTLDAEGEVTETRSVPALSLAEVREVGARFLGDIEQRPPLVSAIKVDGKSMHKRTRAGEVVDLPPRSVRLDELHVESVADDRIELSVVCGKGFYVRSLARDLAEALGTVGHLTALRRTANGGLGVDRAIDFDALRAASRGPDEQRAAVRERLLPLRDVCQRLPHVVLPESSCLAARHGRPIPVAGLALPELAQDAPLIALDELGDPVAIVQRSVDALRVARGFRL